MINITLPDGSQKHFENPPTVQDVAASIGAGLAKAALAGKVDGKLVDTSFKIDRDAKIEIVTEKSPDALDIIRHSTAHLLAQATQRLFPDTQVTIGPVVENGFYYDFARKTPFTPDDLIEDRSGDEEDRCREFAGAAFGDGERRRDQILQREGRNLQGANHRRHHSAGRRNFAVRAGRVGRSMPRPARAEHEQAEGVQADESRRRVLARRSEQRNASARLRHGVDQRKRSERLSASARRSREARSPQTRQAARSVSHAGRGAGSGVLASEGMVDLAGRRAIHARCISRQRLSGSALSADSR